MKLIGWLMLALPLVAWDIWALRKKWTTRKHMMLAYGILIGGGVWCWLAIWLIKS